MIPDPLPPGLRDLEDLLARRPAPEPAGDFRERALHALARARTTPAAAQPGGRGRRLGLAAAALVLALNLGMSAANGFRFQHMSTVTAARATGELRAARPQGGDAVAASDRFAAFAARALASLTPAPDVGVLGRRAFSTEEEREWALP